MAKNKPNKPDSRKIDPRLKSFLRGAAAIIAAEKGLNAESRRKLQSLAARDKLPQELLDEALDRLQQNSASLSNLSHYEKAFIKFLDGEFEKVTGDIVSPRVENEAVKLAKRKYDINGTRAQQLIRARAEEAGIDLISRQDAQSFADQGIVDQIGVAISVDDELRTQLDRFGKKWGLGKEQVDRIITRHMALNRSIRKNKLIRPLLGVLAGCLAIAAFVFVAYSQGWIPDRWLSRVGHPVETLLAKGTETTGDASRFPSSEMDAVKVITEHNPVLFAPLEKVFSDESATSQLGYRQLIRIACSGSNQNPRQIEDLISQLYYLDPDEEAVQAVIAAVREFLDSGPANSFTVQNLKNAYRANSLLGRIRFYPASEPNSMARKKLATDCIESTINIWVDELPNFREYAIAAETEIATSQWNRLIQTAWSSPTQASVVLQPLYELTDGKLKLETLNVYRDDAIATIMQNDTSQWRVLRDQIRSSISGCEPTKLNDWISIFESSNDPSFQVEIGNALLPRLGIEAPSNRHEDISAAIYDFGLQSRNDVLRPVIARSELLDRFFADIVELEANEAPDISPDRIAQLALAINVEWAFCSAIENTTHIDDASFSDFDRLISTPAPRLRELISLPIDRRDLRGKTASSATASDQRRFKTSIERLRNSNPDSASLRVLALKQLSQIAHRFDGISYSDAETMASFLLSDLKRDELLGIEQLVDSFAHWPNLSLAIADRLADSNVSIDQVLTISRLLLNRQFEIGSDVDWKDQLQKMLFFSITNDVENQVDQDPNNVKSNWNRLRIYLSDAYRERLVLSNNSQYSDEHYHSPHQVILRLVGETIDRLNYDASQTDTHSKQLKRAIQLVARSQANEIEKTAFANQLLVGVLVDDLHDSAYETQARQLLASLQERLQRQPQASDQLYATELTLLRVVDLRRLTLVNRLLKRDAQ